MANIVVTYDLPSGNYEAVQEAIKAFGPWAKVGTTTFFVSTIATVNQICDALIPHLGEKDRVFVVDASNNEWQSLGQSDAVVNLLNQRWA